MNFALLQLVMYQSFNDYQNEWWTWESKIKDISITLWIMIETMKHWWWNASYGMMYYLHPNWIETKSPILPPLSLARVIYRFQLFSKGSTRNKSKVSANIATWFPKCCKNRTDHRIFVVLFFVISEIYY